MVSAGPGSIGSRAAGRNSSMSSARCQWLKQSVPAGQAGLRGHRQGD